MKTNEWKLIAVFELCTAVGLILFWIGFFTIGLAPADPPECYFAYEHSFPLPDVILALALVAAAVQVLRNKPTGRRLSLVCAGGLAFLGVLDFSFNMQNGIYAVSGFDLVLNASVNAWCAGFGLFIATRRT